MNKSVFLNDLFSSIAIIHRYGTQENIPVSMITQDSRQVVRDALFVAIPGFHIDGHDFLSDALDSGARILVVQEGNDGKWKQLLSKEIAVIEVENTRKVLSDLSAAFYKYPARRLTVIGVTGTDGKSTTCYMLSAILESAGRSTGIIGGVEFKVGDYWRPNTISETSPEAPMVQSLLSEMVTNSVTDVIIESTSHGLFLHRLDNCEYDLAVFTGLSDDHLDFHGSREEYFAAKLRLFKALNTSENKDIPKRGVVYADDPYFDEIVSSTSAEIVKVGLSKTGSDISVSDIELKESGSSFRVATPAGALEVTLELPGMFNVRNALLAAGAAYALGIGPVAISDGLSSLRGVPGRMEYINGAQPFTVVVDAAATSDAFHTVLDSIKPLVTGRLIVVFGCAGERDPSRRTGMGEAAAEFCDFSILTSENPRSEDPEAIVEQIAVAMENAGSLPDRDFEKIPNRYEAIARAIEIANPGDYLLIAGKGAEQTLITADDIEPWDDRDVVRNLISEIFS